MQCNWTLGDGWQCDSQGLPAEVTQMSGWCADVTKPLISSYPALSCMSGSSLRQGHHLHLLLRLRFFVATHSWYKWLTVFSALKPWLNHVKNLLHIVHSPLDRSNWPNLGLGVGLKCTRLLSERSLKPSDLAGGSLTFYPVLSSLH